MSKKILLTILVISYCLTMSFSYAKDPATNNKLLQAIASNNKLAFKKALDAGADVNYQKANHHTPLTLAVKNKNYDFVSQLLDSKADPNLAMKNFQTLDTPLIIAVLNNDHKMVELLIKKGAKVNTPRKTKNDLDDFSPLMFAIEKVEGDWPDIDMVNLLIANGADVKYATNMGYTTLMAVANYKWMNQEVRIEIAKILLKKGVDPNSRSKHNKTALYYAQQKRFTEMIELLQPLVQPEVEPKDKDQESYKEVFTLD